MRKILTSSLKGGKMKFRSEEIVGLLKNGGDVVGDTVRGISPKDRIVVAQGFGVPKNGDRFPLRFLAYIIPVLHLLKQLPETAVAEFYFATWGAIQASPSVPDIPHWDKTNLIGRVNVMDLLIREYVRKIHPDVAPQVRVLHDRWVYTGSPTRSLISRLADLLEESGDEQILAFAEKRGGPSALRYMAAHALYMRDPINLGVDFSPLLVPDMITGMDHVIMVGGPAEKIFYKVRQVLIQSLGSAGGWKSHQFFTPIGNPPTYHLQKGEPPVGDPPRVYYLQYGQYGESHDNGAWVVSEPQYPTVRDIFQMVKDVDYEMGARQGVFHDLLVLFNDASGGKDFRWCGPAARKLSRGRQADLPLDLLQQGWERIRRDDSEAFH